ncbi:SHNi-TPR domain-containing protein [Aspergillus stella-maris]|uniref:SHNi-TPR domain-containing protein n=1 Tax=Aspergillus stella-maris TaxID=1810926 RepID=UPI003CCCFD47
METQDQIRTSSSPVMATGGMRDELEALIERAAAKDAIKDYNAAAELYSEATEIQAKLNGELSLENADLLFAYGKALYNVAISKSDVLGSKVAGKAQTQPEPAAPKAAPVAENLIKDAVSTGAAKRETKSRESELGNGQNKPYFQFTGDENFDTDSEDEDEENDAGEDEDDDDFANAFEVLDLARILYHKKLSVFEENSEEGKSLEPVPELNGIKEHLADTYDLQAEISLEGERFADAITDLRTALELRQSLFPIEDPSIAECHYKLSLALEFGAVTQNEDQGQPAKVDGNMRKEATIQMEKAIESCRIRMSQEQKKLDSDDSLDEDKRTAVKRRISNVREIISDMEQRLLDLRRPSVSVEKGLNDESENMIKGLLGQIMGESATNKQSLLDTATQNATDLSAFVKRKPVPKNSASSAPKRSAQEQAQEGDTKRARVDDASETST